MDAGAVLRDFGAFLDSRGSQFVLDHAQVWRTIDVAALLQFLSQDEAGDKRRVKTRVWACLRALDVPAEEACRDKMSFRLLAPVLQSLLGCSVSAELLDAEFGLRLRAASAQAESRPDKLS